MLSISKLIHECIEKNYSNFENGISEIIEPRLQEGLSKVIERSSSELSLDQLLEKKKAKKAEDKKASECDDEESTEDEESTDE